MLKELLYPLWDAGLQVGHAVRSPKEAIERAGRDLHAATSILTARLVIGDESSFDELTDRRERWIKRDARRIARRILDERSARYRSVSRAGWALAPDVKSDVGGLRDVHSIGWLLAITVGGDIPDELAGAAGTLLAVREALHAEVRRKSDRLAIEIQPRVARRLEMKSEDATDVLMATVHSTARFIEHHASLLTDQLAATVLGGPRRAGVSKSLGNGVRVEDGVLMVVGPPGDDLVQAMRLVAARAQTGRPVAAPAVTWLARTFARRPLQQWLEELRDAFLAVLRGAHVAAALELLEQVGAWPVLLPEWDGVRGRAQHDPYHRFTVDAHSFVAVAEIGRAIETDPLAKTSAGEIGRLEPLFVAALLHDIGKGSREDHSVAGESLARRACERMGMGPADVEEVAALVRHHLLLPDTATRRDLDDGAEISTVASKIGTTSRLRYLYILAIADGRATGPEGWTEWKAALVRELFTKVLVALETGELPARSDVVSTARQLESFEPSLAGRAETILSTLPPSYLESASVPDMADEVRLLLPPPAPGEARWRIDRGVESDQSVVTVCVPDRPGTLARTAGVFALNRISVLRAQAYSTTDGYALERFIVISPHEDQLKGFEADLASVYAGRLALDARLERKIRDYAPPRLSDPRVTIVQDAPSQSTVIEVRASDALGLLYALAAALSDLDLDIHVAKIDTLGVRVVDVFYVRTLGGEKLDQDHFAEVEASIRHRIARLFG